MSYNTLKLNLSQYLSQGRSWDGTWWELIYTIETEMVGEAVWGINWKDIEQDIESLGMPPEFIATLVEYQEKNRSNAHLHTNVSSAMKNPQSPQSWQTSTDPVSVAQQMNIFDDPSQLLSLYKSPADIKKFQAEYSKRLSSQQHRVASKEEEFKKFGGFFKTAFELVPLFMKREGIQVEGDRLIHPVHTEVKQFLPEHLCVSIEKCIQQEELLNQPICKAKPMISTGIIGRAVDDTLYNIDTERRHTALDNIKYSRGVCADTSWNIIDNMFIIENSEEKPSTIFKHWIWLTKRRSKLRPSDHDIAVVIAGPQRFGKSTYISRLIEPLLGYGKRTSWAELTDKSSVSVFSSYVLFIEEMARLDRADVQLVKKIITGSTWSTRQLYRQSSISVECRSTIIGDINGQLSSMFYDPTGMRRWIELTMNPEIEREEFWQLTNAIDFTALWRSVDDSVGSTYNFTATEDHQEGLRQKLYVEMWLADDERDNTRKFDHNSKAAAPWIDWKQAKMLYGENFEPWCKWHGHPANSRMFYDQMAQVIREKKYPQLISEVRRNRRYYKID